MKKALHTIALLAVAFLAASPLAAQSIDGEWVTEFDRMIRNEGGTVSSGEKSRAKMTLQRKGDSVTGTWEVVNTTPGGRAGTPRPLRGTISGNKLSLQSQFEATVNRNGEQETRSVTVLYEVTVNGDKLEGTMVNKAADMEMPPRPFSAWREKTGK